MAADSIEVDYLSILLQVSQRDLMYLPSHVHVEVASVVKHSQWKKKELLPFYF
jgi:hypothetical protein